MDESDLTYFKHRLEQERQRAETCADAAVALIHRQMADCYEQAIAAVRPERKLVHPG